MTGGAGPAEESVARVEWWAEATMTWFVMTAAATITLLGGLLVPVVLGLATLAALLMALRAGRGISTKENAG